MLAISLFGFRVGLFAQRLNFSQLVTWHIGDGTPDNADKCIGLWARRPISTRTFIQEWIGRVKGLLEGYCQMPNCCSERSDS